MTLAVIDVHFPDMSFRISKFVAPFGHRAIEIQLSASSFESNVGLADISVPGLNTHTTEYRCCSVRLLLAVMACSLSGQKPKTRTIFRLVPSFACDLD